jgi:hypothetical protein
VDGRARVRGMNLARRNYVAVVLCNDPLAIDTAFGRGILFLVDLDNEFLTYSDLKSGAVRVDHQPLLAAESSSAVGRHALDRTWLKECPH